MFFAKHESATRHDQSHVLGTKRTKMRKTKRHSNDVGLRSPYIRRVLWQPPRVLFNEIAGYKNQIPDVYREIRCPLPPRRPRSIVLCKQRNMQISISIASFPVSSSHAWSVSSRNSLFFGGGYRRITHSENIFSKKCCRDRSRRLQRNSSRMCYIPPKYQHAFLTTLIRTRLGVPCGSAPPF